MRPGLSHWPRPDSPGPCADPYVRPVVPGPNCTLGTNPGRTYRFYNGTAVVPFGFGLSYSTFSYAVVSAPTSVSLDPLRHLLSHTRDPKSAAANAFPSLLDTPRVGRYAVNVTNTGTIDADDVVLGFISPPGAGQGGLPLKTLFGFERVHVRAGHTVTVFLYPSMTHLTAVTADGQREALSGRYAVTFGVPETFTFGMGHASVTLVVN